MSDSPVLVIPYKGKDSIPAVVAGRRIVIWTADPGAVRGVSPIVADAEAELLALWLTDQGKVTDIPFDESWVGVPLLVHAACLGRVTELVPRLPVMRQLSLRIMLPTDRDENYSGLRILASLGIHCGVVFNPAMAEWESLLDLATYQYFALNAHGSVAPFDLIADRYVPGEGAHYGDLYFEDPSEYLHLDPEGKVAASTRDLEKGTFIADSVTALEDSASREKWEERKQDWRQFFMTPNRCSCCPGWRLCRGAFEADLDASYPGCREFFTELMDLVEDYQGSTETGV
jgi:hypothetical protein